MEKDICHKIDEIANILRDRDILKNTNYGLFTGKSGIVLFLYYYSSLKHSNVIKKSANRLVEEIFEEINQLDRLDLNICEGICGFYLSLCHLEKFKFITDDYIEYDTNFDNFVYESCLKYFDKRNIDYLYGGTGLLYYLFNRYELSLDSIYTKNINDIIHLLHTNILKDKKWFAYFQLTEGRINFGIAHGITSLFLILSKIYNLKEVNHLELSNILSHLSLYYLEFINSKNNYSYFPDDYIIGKPHDTPIDSRLAWCYGDLGCLIALLNYASITKNNNLKNKVLNILRDEAIKRKDLDKNFIRDAGICHGSSGVANIFQTLYNKYHYPEFINAASYWFQITLDFAKFPTGYAGYCEGASIDEVIYYKNSIDFIGGITGIGLSLMSYISPRYSNWNFILLI